MKFKIKRQTTNKKRHELKMNEFGRIMNELMSLDNKMCVFVDGKIDRRAKKQLTKYQNQNHKMPSRAE